MRLAWKAVLVLLWVVENSTAKERRRDGHAVVNVGQVAHSVTHIHRTVMRTLALQ